MSSILKSKAKSTIPAKKLSQENSFNNNEWKLKTEELEKNVAEKTADLIIKNRDLEIEASLERVRAIAMEMRERGDLLDVSKILFIELKNLGFSEIRNAMINIHDHENKTYLNYDYSDTLGKSISHIHYDTDPTIEKQIKQIRKGKDAFSETLFKGKELTEWKRLRKIRGEKDDPRLKKISALYYYFYSIGNGSIGISTFDGLSKNKLEILKRFRNVFEFAYRRFEDVSKAEAQTREAKIEASLERVRTIAMGMRKPNDLLDISEILYKELKDLGFSEIRNAMINIHNDEEKTFLNYDYSDTLGKSITPLFYNIHPLVEKQIKQVRKGKDAFSETSFKGKELAEWKRFRKSRGEKDDPRLNKTTSLYYYFYSIGTGSIGISTFDGLSKNKLEVLKRFRNVFEFAYRRFEDVSKAEAQAREARIEIALERVRSRTMAMQRSEELSETTFILFRQFLELGEAPDQITIGIIDEKEKVIDFWTTMEGQKISSMVKFPVNDTDLMKKIYLAWKSQKKSISIEIKGKELHDYIEYRIRLTGVSGKNDHVHDRRYIQAAFFSKGLITISTNDPRSDETMQLLERFAGVFDLTYTRFLDLKQAEAQTKEAKIELSLERVRARTMAMHSSDELQEAAVLLFQQIRELGVDTGSCGYVIWENEKKNATVWMSSPEGGIQDPFKLPHTKSKIYKEIYSAKEEGKEFFITEVKGAELKKHFDYLTTVPGIGEKIIQLRKARYKFPETIAYNIAFFKQGYLSFHTHEQKPDAYDIFRRFANVFEQTYTRFLDLQKAEAQAREAQVQLALERVRARTLSMHDSDELEAVADILFLQLQVLGIFTYRSYIGIFRNSRLADIFGAGEIKEFTKTIFDETNGLISKIFVPWRKKDPTAIINTNGNEFECIAYFSSGFVAITSPDYPSSETMNLLERFVGVFNLTYTRFLDLQQSEAQAREAKIEASLERVRSRTMGMQKSDELKEVIQVVYDQLVLLNIFVEHSGFIMDYKTRDDMHIWLADKYMVPFEVTIPYFDCPHWNSFVEAKEKGIDFFANHLSFKEKNKFYKALFKLIPGVPEETLEYYLTCPGLAISTVLLDNVGLYIENFSGTPYSDEENKTLMRFGKVFQQTYTRFLDLQKAEAQARESQIQLALERARAQSMMMQQSNELDDTLRVFHEQVVSLDINSEFSFLWLPNEQKEQHIFWVIWEENKNGSIIFHKKAINYPLDRNEPATAQCLFDWKSNEPVHSYTVPPPDVKNYFAAWSELFVGAEKLKPENFSNGLHYTEAFMKYGCFGVMVETELTADNKKLLGRFAIEFEQTYTRFLDLQKAEAQAREAKIEAALEKVRGKAMAMHNSNDLTDAAGMVYTELSNLGIKPIRSGFVLLTKESRKAKLYPTTSFDNENTISFTGEFEFTGHPVYEKQYESWQKKENYFPVLEGDLLKSYYKILAKGLSVPYKNFQTKNKKQFGTFLPFKEGFLFTWSEEPYSQIEINILERFKGILDLTIRRYLDLKKAEAQTREAQIEASLERVRSKAMAMQKSEDLSVAVGTIFEELDKLELGMLRCGIGILNKEKRCADASFAALKSDDGMVVQVNTNESMDIHPLLKGAFDAWLKQENFSYILEGNDMAEYYETLKKENFNLPDSKQLEMEKKLSQQYYFLATFPAGGIYAFRETEFPGEAKIVIKRFADVINFTYTRFNDLKMAEAQTLEAKIETALERVRSRTLAMQKSDELAETAAVVFKQLINLGIEPNRLYIGIIKDESGEIEFWITEEDGTRVSRKFSGNKNRNISIQKMYDGWKKQKKSIYIDMQGKELEEYLHHLSEELHVPFKHGLSQKRRVQSVAYFSHGFIGIASPEPQSEETILLLERFAAVFNLTYSRFNDLKVAEHNAVQAELDLIKLQTEKKRAEDALTELNATQTQLIQSEKMASLGELTAGIAHEIQNPLNFVNNFSEVNAELIDELNEELEKGNFEEAVAIAKDIKVNEEKIKHHGKRAEGIVKGMLQHSRSSSGVKELTDINSLADEYLRLAYHGLRAKDKSFNAIMETDFDESIGKINIIPQDIGRVILNLITNAFYAVDEKKKSGIENYNPTVSVSTKKTGDKIEVRVKDNGNGIPQKVLEKIFQPFFTTKPTGQGTGLGLSLSYDIVKAHGGELKVETKEGEGTEFVMIL